MPSRIHGKNKTRKIKTRKIKKPEWKHMLFPIPEEDEKSVSPLISEKDDNSVSSLIPEKDEKSVSSLISEKDDNSVSPLDDVEAPRKFKDNRITETFRAPFAPKNKSKYVLDEQADTDFKIKDDGNFEYVNGKPRLNEKTKNRGDFFTPREEDRPRQAVPVSQTTSAWPKSRSLSGFTSRVVGSLTGKPSRQVAPSGKGGRKTRKHRKKNNKTNKPVRRPHLP